MIYGLLRMGQKLLLKSMINSVYLSAPWEKKKQLRISPKMKIFYNKYSNKTGKPIENCGLEIGGGSPRYEGMEEITIVKKMADSNAFNKDFFKEG